MDGKQYTSGRIVNNAVTAQRRSPPAQIGEDLDKSYINQLFGVMRIYEVTDEQIAEAKKMFAGLR